MVITIEVCDPRSFFFKRYLCSIEEGLNNSTRVGFEPRPQINIIIFIISVIIIIIIISITINIIIIFNIFFTS